MTVEQSSGLLATVDSRLAALRTDDTRRQRAFLGAVVLGLVCAWLHWVGLIVAGALVGLTRRSPRWAVLSGVAFGVLSLGLSVLLTPMSAGELVALEPVNYLTAATGLLLPVWGSLARYVI